MALMLGRLYDALRVANVPEEKARAAAEEVATYEQVKSDTYLLKWVIGALIAVVLGVFWMQWQTIARMGEFQGALGGLQAGVASIQAQLVAMNGQLGTVDNRLGNVENRLGNVENRLGEVEARLDRVAGEGSRP